MTPITAACLINRYISDSSCRAMSEVARAREIQGLCHGWPQTPRACMPCMTRMTVGAVQSHQRWREGPQAAGCATDRNASGSNS
jgi:hypothetical protein